MSSLRSLGRQAGIAQLGVLVLVFVAGATFAEPGSANDREALAGRIDRYLQPFVEAGHLSGNLLVAKGSDVLYERSFGMADHELHVPNSPRMRFNVASITKPMTVIVLIQLAQEGKVAMSDPLSKWIPTFPRGGEITVEHLARHRAGIPHRVTEEADETRPRTAAEMVEFASRKPLEFEPGSQHSYSSGGFSVLARVLELAGGASYGELLRQRVFAPAGIVDSAHPEGRRLIPERARPYLPDGRGGVMHSRYEDLSYLVGAGSVYSTARDLFVLLGAVRAGTFGAGVRASNEDENGIDWNGATNGYRAFADWHRESDVTVILTANLPTGAADRIRADVPRIAAGEEVPAPIIPTVTPVPVAVSRLRLYAGGYELRPGTTLQLRVEDDLVWVNDWILVPTGEKTFFSPQDYGTVQVVLDEQGRATRLDWTIGGTTYPCPRRS